MGIVRDAIVEHIKEQDARRTAERQARKAKSTDEPRLSVSSLGKCPRAAVMDALQEVRDFGEPRPHDDGLLELFELGHVWQAETSIALHDYFGHEMVTIQEEERVENDVWRGRMDFSIPPCEEYVPGAIIEHKATGSWSNVPFRDHIWQVLAYKYLLGDPDIETWLYYRGYNKWAELKVWQFGDDLVYEGEMDGKPKSGVLPNLPLRNEMDCFEFHWKQREVALPPILDIMNGCFKPWKGIRAYPSCRWLPICHPDVEWEPIKLR